MAVIFELGYAVAVDNSRLKYMYLTAHGSSLVMSPCTFVRGEGEEPSGGENKHQSSCHLADAFIQSNLVMSV